uniref:DUF4283 domain-containing protein n=1 Tax=Lactuca sativa TaxID=4236 RepID=A0A9R1WMN7_LACSA|nr:hypothetical protein LSAT_V11C100000010 [Lactuca sativa]
MKSDSGAGSKLLIDSPKAKSVTSLVNKFESEAISHDPKTLTGISMLDSPNLDKTLSDSVSNSPMAPSISCVPIKKKEESIEDLSSPVREFENDIANLCSPGEKDAMLIFWNGLTTSEKEGFVHGLRFTKKKYNSEGESDSAFDDSIDSIRKLSSVSQRNDILMNWKDLNDKKKEKVFHKLCTSKIKKQVEANFKKNRVPFKSSSSLFPVSIDMKKTSDLEASDGLHKIGETVLNLIPEGVPVSSTNEQVVVDLHQLCSLQHQVKEKKIRKKIEIDELVSQQLEQVCNEIVYQFPSKFSHLDIDNDGEFKFNYVDAEEKDPNDQMVIDGNENFRTNDRNSNGGLLISKSMLEKMKAGNLKSEEEKPVSNNLAEEVEKKDKISYAEKVSGKKLNAANLILKIKKNAELPNGVVEMPLSDILKGCSPFKTTLYGYFIDKHVNFFNVNKFAHNMWKKHGLEEVMVNDEGIYFFRFSSEQGMLSVLEGGVWMIFESALVVRRWTTGVSSVKDQHDKVPVWVKIYNVPLEYWNGTGLSHIAWEIGKPLDVDAHTAKMCQEHWGRPAFMRILIEMSAAREWLKEVHVYSSDLTTGERILSKCKIEYAWNPSKCSHCKVYGHKDSTCGILLAKEVKGIDDKAAKEINEDGIKIDLMEVLIASTKKVEEDNEGFQNVVRRNKGNNMGVKNSEEMGSKRQNPVQGQNGKFQGNGRNWGGNAAGNQGQKRNNYVKNESNYGGYQWNKGKGIQGQNGKINEMNGINRGIKMEQGQNSKNGNFVKKEKDTGNFLIDNSKKDKPTVFREGQEQKQKEAMEKKNFSGQNYVPKSGPDIKINSNFDRKVNFGNFHEPVIPVSNNKFDVLINVEEENQFVVNKCGIPEIDLDYLDNVDQMEVIGGIPLADTNKEVFSNDV